VVTDARCSAAPTLTAGDTNSDTLLDSGETWTFTCSFTAQTGHAVGETDPIVNTATVSGRDLDNDAVTGGTSNSVSVDLVHAAISGRKFLDLDADGVQGADELALRGWTINLFRDSNGNTTFEQGTDALLATQVTDFAGNYSFTELVAGTYFVREVVRVGFTQTSPDRDLTLAGDSNETGQDFGNHLQGAALIPDPRTAGDTALLVVGTQSADTIAIGRDRRTTSTTVTLNGRTIGLYNPNGSIIVYGLGGNDQINTHRAITRPMIIHGGDGNDNLEGGSSHDVLVGHDGRDTLRGMIGRDVLIGGTGRDQMNGDGGEDVLVAGSTDFDGRIEALAAILAEWKSNRLYAARVNNLRNGSGGSRLNGDFFLDSTTTHDDNVADTLTGSTDLDWFLAHQNGDTSDRLKGRISDELLDAI
jgi:Ca2+-binding RTX toxin-like protein